MLRTTGVSIVIPTWNEESNIGKVIREVKRLLERYGYPYEVIIVDRYSADRTVRVARSLGARVLYDTAGKGAALIKGFKAARHKVVISMDADLSNRPNELLLLIAGIEAGYEICAGSRFLTGGGSDDMPWHRKAGNKFFVTLVNLMYRSRYTDMCYGYRSFTSGALRRLGLVEKGFGIETEINIKAAKKQMRVLEVPSFEKPRAKGAGKLHTWRDGYAILRVIIKNAL